VLSQWGELAGRAVRALERIAEALEARVLPAPLLHVEPEPEPEEIAHGR
jgi:hypothetical protein